MKNASIKRYGMDFIINTILCIILVILVLGFISVIQKYNRETFVPNNHHLEPAEFPVSVNEPILYNDYNVKSNTNLTKNNNSHILKEYQVYPSSYEQKTNNKYYWKTPDNGMFSSSEFYGTLYENTEQKEEIVSKAIPLDSSVTRVNWWAANTCE